ncbi:methyl-accepting chemotaxis protein [Brachyspira aalborgi]|uniref:Methyl-accepting chemotaxis protein n=1 Tax=Brachyspira aalborgi TaxID=29522 RepID=A0ABY3KBU5_9SPIR|nr:methyl-accepting chemotaxis protein [Brachyspira aalborgi]TXJ34404.1 methyl-accepting chemotaxis protein [Brachyspira aalborgi]TXJ43900.1 methyl-accepting chemotaxis protein [Brachyspira aalborgi]
MIFQESENILLKRLKVLLPISFLVNGIITVSTYSFMLNYLYRQFTPIRKYSYFFIMLITFGVMTSIFFDCLKVERGKFIKLGFRYILKTLIAFIGVALVTYPIYIYDGTMTIFEVMNIRFVIVILFMNFAATISALFFILWSLPLYKATGRKEFHLSMAYIIAPPLLTAAIGVIAVVNGLHYRNAFEYYGQYNDIVDREYVSDASSKIYDAINEYVKLSENLSFYLGYLPRFGYNYNEYSSRLTDYLRSRFGGYNDVNAFYVVFDDIRRSGINFENENTALGNLNIFLSQNNDFNFVATTNASLNIPPADLEGKELFIDLVKDSTYFYIYTPITYNGNRIGYVAVEVRNSAYTRLFEEYMNINIFVVDKDYEVINYNRMNLLGEFQSILNNPKTSSDLKNEINDSYLDNILNSKVILDKNYNLNIVKYLLFDNLYIMGAWENIIPYKQNMTFRRTILTASITIYLGVIFFLVIVITLIIVFRKSIVSARKVSDALSEGAGDLTIRLPVINIDETGDLIHSFNRFLDKIQSIITNIKENTYVLTGNIQNIRSSINIGVSDFETLNKEFKEELINSNKIAESSASASRVSFMQRTRINAVNETIRQLLDNINEISEKMKSQSDAVNRTSVSVQQMMANIVTVSQGSTRANTYSKILDAEARDGGNISESVADSIQGIKDYSKQITNITQVIHNISEQTNLLAMNAAIEAAHAGDYGRGFTVVAEKIRKLAEDTANNSTVINDLIEETIQAIEQTVALVSKSAASSDKILESSVMLSDVISSISMANEELDVGRKDILNNVSNLNIITEAVQELSVRQMQMSSMVSQNIAGVDKLAEDVVNVVNNTENDVKVLLGSIENVAELSNTTVDSMESMDKKIKELQYIFLQLYKLVISFKTEKTEEELRTEIKKRSLVDKIRIKLEKRAKKEKAKKDKKKREEKEINQL